MYDSAHSVSAAHPVNGSVGGDLVVDGSGTINPAALNNGTSLFGFSYDWSGLWFPALVLAVDFFFLFFWPLLYFMSFAPSIAVLLLHPIPPLLLCDGETYILFCRAPSN